MSTKRVHAALAAIGVLLLLVSACASDPAEQAVQTPASPSPSGASPAGTFSPQATVAPTKPQQSAPTQPPQAAVTSSPTPTPQPEPVTVVAFGHGQDGIDLGVAFLVSNPNADLAIERTQYQIAIFDQGGAVVKTDSGNIDLVLPSQTLGVATRISLSEGVQAGRIEVQLQQGKATPAEPVPDMGVSQIAFRVGDRGSEASGVISNPLDRSLDGLLVAAIAYNQAGEIVGGGKTFSGFVLANGIAGVQVPMVSADDATRVELYPTVKGLAALQREKEIPAGAEPPVLLKSGFGQDRERAGYGLVVNNPNPGYAISNTGVQIAAYDAEGHVMVVSQTFIPVLLPGETQGLGGAVSLGENEIADRLDVQLLAGTYVEREAGPFLSAENVSYQQDEYVAKTTGMIVNPFAKELSAVGVCAVAYDGAGEIIGGGVTRVSFLPANGKAAVEVVTVSDEPAAQVELYAGVTTLSAIE